MADVELVKLVPYVIGVGNVGSAIMIGAGRLDGWLVLAGTQAVFGAYGVASGLHGFVLQLLMVLAALNSWDMTRQRQGAPLLTGVAVASTPRFGAAWRSLGVRPPAAAAR